MVSRKIRLTFEARGKVGISREEPRPGMNLRIFYLVRGNGERHQATGGEG